MYWIVVFSWLVLLLFERSFYSSSAHLLEWHDRNLQRSVEYFNKNGASEYLTGMCDRHFVYFHPILNCGSKLELIVSVIDNCFFVSAIVLKSAKSLINLLTHCIFEHSSEKTNSDNDECNKLVNILLKSVQIQQH